MYIYFKYLNKRFDYYAKQNLSKTSQASACTVGSWKSQSQKFCHFDLGYETKYIVGGAFDLGSETK